MKDFSPECLQSAGGPAPLQLAPPSGVEDKNSGSGKRGREPTKSGAPIAPQKLFPSPADKVDDEGAVFSTKNVVWLLHHNVIKPALCICMYILLIYYIGVFLGYPLGSEELNSGDDGSDEEGELDPTKTAAEERASKIRKKAGLPEMAADHLPSASAVKMMNLIFNLTIMVV